MKTNKDNNLIKQTIKMHHVKDKQQNKQPTTKTTKLICCLKDSKTSKTVCSIENTSTNKHKKGTEWVSSTTKMCRPFRDF